MFTLPLKSLYFRGFDMQSEATLKAFEYLNTEQLISISIPDDDTCQLENIIRRKKIGIMVDKSHKT